MSDDNKKAAANLRKLGERVRAGWAKLHPVSAKQLAAVDASNELLHRYGHPTHAFDADTLKGALEVYAAVKNKTADAAVYDGPQILVLAKTDSNFKVLEDLLTKERYGVSMPKGSDLRAVVDEVVKAQRKDLYNKWMK